MLQIRTTLNGQHRLIDLYGDEDIKVSISYAEVEDITRKNSVFTQSFNLPGSKNNNDIFNHFYDFNALTLDYQPRQKFECELIDDGFILYEGFLRLESVTRVVDEIIYQVTFYNAVGDVVSNIGDKYMGELDLSDFNFSGYSDIVNYYLSDPDLDPSLKTDPRPYVNGQVYFPVINKGYQYSADTLTGEQIIVPSEVPRLNWPFPSSDSNDFWDNPSPDAYSVPDWYMVPSLKLKEFYTRIFSEAGYSIKSDFFDTAYFDRIYIPLTFSNETLYPLNTYDPYYHFFKESPNPTSFSSTGITYTSYTWNQTETQTGIPSTESSQRFPNVDTIEDNIAAGAHSPDYIELTRPGLYQAEIRWKGICPPTGSEERCNVVFRFRTRDLTQSGGTPFNSGTTVYSQTYQTAEGNYEDEIIRFTFQNDGKDGKYIYGCDFVIDCFDPGDSFTITSLDFQIISGPKYISGDTFDAQAEIPDPNTKQIDFIQSINRLFNLLVIPEPDEPKTFRVEPVIDWIGTGPVLDWTSKLDRRSPINVQPVTSILNGTIDFTYMDDEGYGNALFLQKRAKKFGSNQVRLNQDYKDRITSMDNIFSSQTDYTLNVTEDKKSLTMPMYFIEEVQDVDGIVASQFKPYKTPPRMLFRSVPIPVVSARKEGTTDFWNLADDTGLSPQQVQYWYNNNRFITYPWGVSALTHSLNWNKEHQHDPLEYSLAAYEDLYDIYWSDYITDMISDENRLVKCKMYFEPHELAQLDFSEKIFVDNTVFRINRIYNYSLLEPGLADVELIKITKEYQQHRVRYYDLENCTGGTDLHTSTDLTFSVYAYVGYNVKIDGVCYNVVDGTYNSGYTYQQVDLTDVYQSGCTCSTTLLSGGGFQSFYDEKYAPAIPTPTPSPSFGASPTPTVTPTITPTPVSPAGCDEYQVDNENPYSVQIYYTDCCTSGYTNTTINAFQTLYICSLTEPTGAVSVGNLGRCETPCGTATPTPTPTSTPPPPTPSVTPSVTPSSGFLYYYQCENCDNPLLTTIVASNTFYAPSKSLKLSNGDCVVITGTDSGPFYNFTEIASYTDCDSCPR